MTEPWWRGRATLALLVLITATPLLWPTVPPLLDLPGHMARYRVMLGDDPGLARWYAFRWKPIGYLGVDLVVLALGPVMGLEPAVKLVAVLIPVLTVTGMLWIAHEAHGRVEPPAIWALPLAFHLCFQYGFLNYTFAMALALNAFALWLRLGRLGRARLRAGLFVAIAAGLWTAHLFAWVALGAMVGSAEVARGRGEGLGWPAAVRRAALLGLPLAPPALMLLGWRPGGADAGSDWWPGLALKPGWIAGALRDRWRAFDVASMTAIGLLLYRCLRAPGWRWSPPVLGAALGLLALFVALPFGAAYDEARFAPYVVALLLLAPGGAGVPARELRLLALAGLAFFGARTAAATASFAIEGADWDRRLAALDHVPRGARVLSLATAPCGSHWRMFRLGHLPGMLVVRRGAFSNDQFDLGSTALLTVTAPGLDGFAVDPSQLVMADSCPGRPAGAEFRTLAEALARFPRGRFDNLWLIDPVPVDPQLLRGLVLVWSDGRDRLYRVR